MEQLKNVTGGSGSTPNDDEALESTAAYFGLAPKALRLLTMPDALTLLEARNVQIALALRMLDEEMARFRAARAWLEALASGAPAGSIGESVDARRVEQATTTFQC